MSNYPRKGIRMRVSARIKSGKNDVTKTDHNLADVVEDLDKIRNKYVCAYLKTDKRLYYIQSMKLD